MSKRLPNHIWRYRKRHGLTQDEMAFLVGSQDGATVSRWEQGRREPSLRTAFACQIIFGVPVHEICPGIFEEVEQEVRKRAPLLSERLKASSGTRLVWYKQKLLDAIRSRKEGELAQGT